MTYLPKTSGSEEDNTEQAEELEVRFYKYLVKLKRKYLISYFTILRRKINYSNEVNVWNKNYYPGHLFILPKNLLNISFR